MDGGTGDPSQAPVEEVEIEDSTTGVTGLCDQDRRPRPGDHRRHRLGGILGLADITQLYWDTVNEQGGIHGRDGR